MLAIPKLALDTPERLVHAACVSATATSRAFTVSEAQALGSHKKSVPAGAIRDICEALWTENSLRKYRKVTGKPGRPLVLYYPEFVWRIAGSRGLELYVVSTASPAPEPIFDFEVLLLEPDEPLSAEATSARPAKTQRTQPATGSDEPTEHPHASGQTAQMSGQTAGQTAGQSPPDCQDRDRMRAYSMMQMLVRKSEQERGFGCTAHELRWTLEKSGFTAEQAFTYMRDLSSTRPEAYKTNGLWRDYPKSPHNKTEDVRFRLRSPGQSQPDEIAEFEANQALEYVKQNPKQVTSVL